MFYCCVTEELDNKSATVPSLTDMFVLRTVCIPVLFTVALLNDVLGYERHFCADVAKRLHKRNDYLAFILDPESGDQTFTCAGDSKSISCCMSGYSWIEWQQYTDDEHNIYKMWAPVSLRNLSGIYLEEENQTLVIENMEGEHDYLYYKCIGYGKESSLPIENVIKLTIQDCTKMENPVFLQPSDNVTLVHVVQGSQAHLKCSLFRGNNNTEITIKWYRMKTQLNSTVPHFDYIDDDERFMQYSPKSLGAQVDHSFLIINNIKPDDFNWIYVCDAVQEDMSYMKRIFKLTEREASESQGIIHLIVLTMIAIGLIFMAVGVVLYRYHVEFCIFYKTRIYRTSILEDKEYHVFLLHSRDSLEDKRFALDVLQPFLQNELKYRVFSEAAIQLEEDFQDHYADGLENSNVLMVVMSKQLLEDQSCKLCIRDAISTENKIIYIIREPLDGDFSSVNDIMAALRMGKKVKWWQKDDDYGVSTATCKILCDLEPTTPHFREANSPDYCRKKIQLYLLHLLEDSGKTSSSKNLEQYPIVTTHFTQQC